MKKRWDFSALYLMAGLTILGIMFSVQTEKNTDIYVDSVKLVQSCPEEEMIPLTQGNAAMPAASVTNGENRSAGTDKTTDVLGADHGLQSAVADQQQTNLLLPTAAGIRTKRGNSAVIDFSNTADGYVMVQYEKAASARMKVQIKGPTATYTYNLTAQKWNVFPLSDGNGTYQVAVYMNMKDNQYAQILAEQFPVALADEFAPFLRPNQYVDFSPESEAVQLAVQLTRDCTDSLKKVECIYDYVVENITYDTQKAAAVSSGYLPVLDSILAEKKGICFDYAALMTGMLRSIQIPCKLVVGYAGTAYHAWISVWTAQNGWVDGVIYFDGSSWHRMDPTFAASMDKSAAVMEYIGNGANYIVKYLY